MPETAENIILLCIPNTLGAVVRNLVFENRQISVRKNYSNAPKSRQALFNALFGDFFILIFTGRIENKFGSKMHLKSKKSRSENFHRIERTVILIETRQGGATTALGGTLYSTRGVVSGAGQTTFQYHLQRRIDVDSVDLVAGIVYLMKEWNGWLRRRIRMYIWKQWKKPKTRVTNLKKLGMPE